MTLWQCGTFNPSTSGKFSGHTRTINDHSSCMILATLHITRPSNGFLCGVPRISVKIRHFLKTPLLRPLCPIRPVQLRISRTGLYIVPNTSSLWWVQHIFPIQLAAALVKVILRFSTSKQLIDNVVLGPIYIKQPAVLEPPLYSLCIWGSKVLKKDEGAVHIVL